MRRALPAIALLLVACGSQPKGTGGAAGSGGVGTGGHGSSNPEAAALLYPDLATLQSAGVARTCALNQGVCHAAKEYPELGTVADLAAAVGAPCQLGVQDPATTLAACETTGDMITLGGQDYEILHVDIADDQPYPPTQVTLKLPAVPPSLDATTARIHRPNGKGGDIVSKFLQGATLTAGSDVVHVVVDLTTVVDTTIAPFLDVRAWHGDRVRQGDPNGDGMAHTSAQPWAEIVPGDPARSFLYQRLLKDTYGPVMPLIPRTWSPAATRALWCWIRGLPADATAATIDPTKPIEYDGCPVDPAAPDPNASGGWPAVKTIFQGKCATAPCHSAAVHSEMLDLTPDAATFAKDVINVSSTQAAGAVRVVPGQPAASYLLCKVSPSCNARASGTALMPQGATPLSDTELQTISDWIQAGAPTE